MANTLYDEDEKELDQAENDTGTQQLSTGTTSEIGGGQAATQTQGSKTVPGGTERKGSGMGSRLSNLREYVKVNQPEVRKMGEQMVGDVASKTKQFKSDVSGAKSQFQTGLDKAQEEVGQAESIYKGLQGTGTDLTKTLQSLAQDRSVFDKFKAGQFQDPKFDQAGFQSRLEDIQSQAKRFETEKGRFQELQDRFGNKQGYTRGQRKLDQLLLQSTPDAFKAKLDPTSDKYYTAQEMVQQAQSGLGSGVDAGDLASKQAEVKKQLAGVDFTKYDDPIETAFGQRKTDIELFNQALSNVGGYIDANEAKVLGRPDLAGTFIGKAERQALATGGADLLSADEAARLQALGTITGTNYLSEYGLDPNAQGRFTDVGALTGQTMTDLASKSAAQEAALQARLQSGYTTQAISDAERQSYGAVLDELNRMLAVGYGGPQDKNNTIYQMKKAIEERMGGLKGRGGVSKALEEFGIAGAATKFAPKYGQGVDKLQDRYTGEIGVLDRLSKGLTYDRKDIEGLSSLATQSQEQQRVMRDLQAIQGAKFAYDKWAGRAGTPETPIEEVRRKQAETYENYLNKLRGLQGMDFGAIEAGLKASDLIKKI